MEASTLLIQDQEEERTGALFDDKKVGAGRVINSELLATSL